MFELGCLSAAKMAYVRVEKLVGKKGNNKVDVLELYMVGMKEKLKGQKLAAQSVCF